MKTLTLVRHAKSDWGHDGLLDIDRPLNQRGYTDAYVMSNWFASTEKKEFLMVSSPAVRAISTAFIFARALKIDANLVKVTPHIYESTSSVLKTLISEFPNTNNSVLLFGHNPGITNLCNELNGDLFFDNVPTCGVIQLQFTVNTWQEVPNANGKIAFHKFPKLFNPS